MPRQSTPYVNQDDTAGPRGQTGSQGATGAQGADGAQGNQGVQGTQGVQGSQGTQGVQGAQGGLGPQGNQGAQGAAGAQGNQGTQGVQGSQGTQGVQGSQGTQGVQGSQGTQGVQGSQGTQGVQGATGNNQYNWPGYKAGDWYYPIYDAATPHSGTTMTVNIVYLTQFFVPQTCTISDLGAVFTSVSSTKNIQLGIYNNDNSAINRPGTLFCRTGSIVSPATGNTAGSASITGGNIQIAAGTYWAAVEADTTGVLGVTCRNNAADISMGQFVGSATLGTVAGSVTALFTALSSSQTFNTWGNLTGATFTEITTQNFGPLIVYKVASVP